MNQYRDEGTPAPKSPAEAGQLAQEGKKSTAAFVGNVKKLDDAIVAPVVSHPDVQLVKHANSKAFVLASVPDHMAAAADCQGRESGKEIYFEKAYNGKCVRELLRDTQDGHEISGRHVAPRWSLSLFTSFHEFP